jgi:hypothetical protein
MFGSEFFPADIESQLGNREDEDLKGTDLGTFLEEFWIATRGRDGL